VGARKSSVGDQVPKSSRERSKLGASWKAAMSVDQKVPPPLPQPPRSAISDEAAEKFVNGAEPGAARPRTGPTQRRSDAKGERINVHLTPQLDRSLRVRCALERRSLRNAIEEAVAAWMVGYVEPKGP
jgi:hypothetical protein